MRVTSLFSGRCSLSEHDRISSKLSREKHEHFKSSTLLVVMEHDTLSNDTSDKKGRLNQLSQTRLHGKFYIFRLTLNNLAILTKKSSPQLKQRQVNMLSFT